VTTISLLFDSDSFVLKKKELDLNASSLEEKEEKELCIKEEESESKENTVERVTSLSFNRR